MAAKRRTQLKPPSKGRGTRPERPAPPRHTQHALTPPRPDSPAAAEPSVGTIQWFPGHMARTRRKIQESLKLVDAVVEIVDARIPLSSRNPEMDALTASRPRMVVLNKADLADESASRRWLAYFRRQGLAAITVDCKSGHGFAQFEPALRELVRPLLEKWESKGANRTVRAWWSASPMLAKAP